MKSLSVFLATLVSIFAPEKAALITVLALVAADLITGLYAAWKSKTPITSAGLRRTITKIAVYEFALAMAFLAQQYLTGATVPLASIVSGYIGLTEITSISENLNAIAGGSLLASLISKLGSTNG